MLGVWAIFALFGGIWAVELSLGKETETQASTFEADCTIIDTVKKLSSRLWLSSESLNDEQLEVALAKARKKNRKSKKSRKAKERKLLVNASHHYFPRNESMKENETIQGEITNEQEGSSEINIANETTESANISVVINSSFVSTAEVFVDTKTSTPLLLSSCEYVDLTVLQSICGPGFAADFTHVSQDLHQTVFFDVGSGHTILGVHSEPRWQCCRRREDRTEGVGCRMGATCPASANAI